MQKLNTEDLKLGILNKRLDRLRTLRKEKNELYHEYNTRFTTIEKDEELINKIKSINTEISIILNQMEGDR